LPDPVHAAGVGAPTLPIRLDARRGEASVRLIVDQWAAAVQ
jgi:hypothetical protein